VSEPRLLPRPSIDAQRRELVLEIVRRLPGETATRYAQYFCQHELFPFELRERVDLIGNDLAWLEASGRVCHVDKKEWHAASR
jgi:hypothetical protein